MEPATGKETRTNAHGSRMPQHTGERTNAGMLWPWLSVGAWRSVTRLARSIARGAARYRLVSACDPDRPRGAVLRGSPRSAREPDPRSHRGRQTRPSVRSCSRRRQGTGARRSEGTHCAAVQDDGRRIAPAGRTERTHATAAAPRLRARAALQAAQNVPAPAPAERGHAAASFADAHGDVSAFDAPTPSSARTAALGAMRPLRAVEMS
jgi:hypothetical protein